MAALLIVISLPDARAADNAKPLVFCAEPAAMPRTGKSADGSPQGLDVAIARLVCEKLGREAEFHWCASPACSRNCLGERRCDVILGHPLDEGAPKEIAWTVPYAGSQFGLVVREGTKDARSLADLVRKRIGIVTGTVALPDSQHEVVRFRTREEALDRFHDERLDAAFVDADFAAWHVHNHPQLGLELLNDYVPREHWNIALAMRSRDADLVVELNKALAELAQSGELANVYAQHGAPYRPPFTASAGRPATLDTWKRVQDRGELRIAIDPANLPYSSAKDGRPGIDLELARELCREMNVRLRVEWLDVLRETAIGKLLEGECDVALGAAVDPNAVEDEEELAGKVIYSRPYYGTGYLLVGRRNGPPIKALEELKGERSRRLGAEAGSVADYRLRQSGYQRSLFRNQLAVLKAINDGAVDYGYLWANLGWTLHATPDFELEIVPGFVSPDRWNIAVAMRKGDFELKRQVDAALARLTERGAVAAALARYHVPYFPPFDEKPKSADGAQATVIRHPVAERGIEPRMQKVQASRNPYSGLARIRSAGALIVGLDQNNLPLSTAHPEPTGLDYEIAGLLAERLGVSLRIYWGYSSHDSYPSKLASKKLCDVMLGAMPDDRFGDRVLFSTPYYLAAYQCVVLQSTDAAGVSGQDALAIEPGLVLRGVGGRATKPYPSLEDILQAVAKGEVTAGYVISTKGPWLAERRWPGKLRFVDGDAADRLPICAAVRKADKDLKAAIDDAFGDLARSGKFAEVFARWHVPFIRADNGKQTTPLGTDGGKP